MADQLDALGKRCLANPAWAAARIRELEGMLLEKMQMPVLEYKLAESLPRSEDPLTLFFQRSYFDHRGWPMRISICRRCDHGLTCSTKAGGDYLAEWEAKHECKVEERGEDDDR